MSGVEQLLRRLNPDRELALRQYDKLRNRLMVFFNHRGCAFADELADETLDRLAAKLDTGAEIDPNDIERYAIGIAKHVHQEGVRNPLNSAQPIEDTSTGEAIEVGSHDIEVLQQLIGQAARRCRNKCLANNLTDEERGLILEYYKDDWRQQVESRKRLAATLSLSPEGLRSRASRILKELKACARKCLDGENKLQRVQQSRQFRQ